MDEILRIYDKCIFRISNLNKIKGSGFYFFLFPPPLSAMQGRFFR